MSQATVEKFRLARSKSTATFCSTHRPARSSGWKDEVQGRGVFKGPSRKFRNLAFSRTLSEATVAFVSTQIQRALRCKLPCSRSVPAGEDYLSPYSLAALSWVTLRRTFSDKQPNSCSRKRIESGQVPSGWG